MKMITAALATLAFSAAAQAPVTIPVLSICQNGKLVAIQIMAPAPDVYTVRIPPNVCAKSVPARPPASRPANTV